MTDANLPFRQTEVERMRENAKVAMAESGRMMAAYGRAQTEANRFRAALERIDCETRHVSGNAGHLGQIARDALDGDAP